MVSLRACAVLLAAAATQATAATQPATQPATAETETVASYPATVHVTYASPREIVYDAGALVPLLVAIDHVDAAAALQLRVAYWLHNAVTNETLVANRTVVAPAASLSATDGTDGKYFLAADALDGVFGTAGVWRLTLDVASANCSATTTAVAHSVRSRTIVFETVLDDGAGPDVARDAANETCGAGGHGNTLAFAVLGAVNVVHVDNATLSSELCATQAARSNRTDTVESLMAGACAIDLSAVASGTVDAMVTAAACRAATPVVSCASASASSAASGLRPGGLSAAGSTGAAFLVGAFGFLFAIA